MPVLSDIAHDDGDDKQYFTSLRELDAWADARVVTHDVVVPYAPRGVTDADGDERGRLLVCHDFKGGYSETATALHYTFNFWAYCDVFVYFSHHRVTIPPPGWTSAAHRRGVKMLGTLIFEHQESEADGLRLLFGRLPASPTGPAIPVPLSEANQVPVTRHYARLLAALARARGFDGYLLNFEWALRADGGAGHARALTAWIALLRAELEAQVGPHTEVIWYDSVVLTGQVRWQDRLNAYNLPFFLPSTGFFTNYTWHPTYPSRTATYFSSLNPAHISPHNTSKKPKTLADIYTGLDVWGRGLHGGGGLGTYRALEHIQPASSGLSAALFGQGWTWESQQDAPGFSWETWWKLDNLFWLGPDDASDTDTRTGTGTGDERARAAVSVPPMPPLRRADEFDTCTHGAFRPLSDFFPRRPPPDPRLTPFCTTFSPGVGRAWFVAGRRVYNSFTHKSGNGWTDVSAQSSLGDLLWPRPAAAWENLDSDDMEREPAPRLRPSLDFDDAWNGGSSVRIPIDIPATHNPNPDADVDVAFRCIWIPIQTVPLSSGSTYEAKLVFKTVLSSTNPNLDVDVGFVFKSPAGSSEALDVTPLDTTLGLPSGWIAQSVRIDVRSDEGEEGNVAHAGIVVGFAIEDTSRALAFTIVLGQLAVWPVAPPDAIPASPRILYADFALDESASADGEKGKEKEGNEGPRGGVLSWGIAAHYPPLVYPLVLPDAEDPTPVWHLDDTTSWFPRLAYCNVYALAHDDKLEGGAPDPPRAALDPTNAAFVGTNGLEGVAGRTRIDPSALPENVRVAKRVRFYVQGVTDRGEVLGWARCAFVDAVMR